MFQCTSKVLFIGSFNCLWQEKVLKAFFHAVIWNYKFLKLQKQPLTMFLMCDTPLKQSIHSYMINNHNTSVCWSKRLDYAKLSACSVDQINQAAKHPYLDWDHLMWYDSWVQLSYVLHVLIWWKINQIAFNYKVKTTNYP